MKVVYNGGNPYLHLTRGKIYEVKISPHDHFFVKYIVDDIGKTVHYSTNWFTPLNKIRQDKLNEILK